MAVVSTEERSNRLEGCYEFAVRDLPLRWLVLCVLVVWIIGCSSPSEPTPLVHLRGNELVEVSTVVDDDTDDLPTMPSEGDARESVPRPTPVPSPMPTSAPTPTAVPSATPEPDDHGDDLSTATEIDVGATIAGKIGDVDDVDYFRISTEAGKGYEVYLDGWHDIRLLDQRGNVLAFEDDASLVWFAWDEEYYVSVDWGEGEYAISVLETEYRDLHGDNSRWATSLTLGEAVDGVIGTYWDDDYFSFEAIEGEFYTIAVSLGSLEDSQITVVTPGGRELAMNDNYADTLASKLEWRAPRSGEFFVRLDSGFNSFAQGSYSLTVDVSSYEDDHGDDTAKATEIGLDEVMDGMIGHDADFDYFWFEAEKGETYYLDMVLNTLSEGWLAVYDLKKMELRDADAIFSSHSFDWPDKRRLIWTAPSDGRHYFAVIPNTWSNGEYLVSTTGIYSVAVSLSDYVDDHPDNVTDETIETLVVPIHGYLGAIDDVDYFKFNAVKDEYYLINLDYECPIYFPGDLSRPIHEWACDPTDMRVTLYGSDGAELKYQDSWNFDSYIYMKWIAIADGEFYVAVSRSPEESALFADSYVIGVEVSLERDHDADEQALAAEIGMDETIEAEIGADRDVDFFKFMAEAGQTYLVYLDLSRIDYINTLVWGVDDRKRIRQERIEEGKKDVLIIYAEESGYHYIMLWVHDIFEYYSSEMGSYSIRIEESD